MNQQTRLEVWDEAESEACYHQETVATASISTLSSTYREGEKALEDTSAHNKVCILVAGSLTISF